MEWLILVLAVVVIAAVAAYVILRQRSVALPPLRTRVRPGRRRAWQPQGRRGGAAPAGGAAGARAARARAGRPHALRRPVERRPAPLRGRARATLAEADDLVVQVMAARGYPVDDPDERTGMVVADHPELAEDYRTAHAIRRRSDGGEATLDEHARASSTTGRCSAACSTTPPVVTRTATAAWPAPASARPRSRARASGTGAQPIPRAASTSPRERVTAMSADAVPTDHPAEEPTERPTEQLAEHPAEPAVDQSTEPPTDPPVEQLAEPTGEPPTDPPVEQLAEPTGEPPAEQPGEQLAEPPFEPAVDQSTAPPADPAVEQLAEQPAGASEPVALAAEGRPGETRHLRTTTGPASPSCRSRSASSPLGRHPGGLRGRAPPIGGRGRRPRRGGDRRDQRRVRRRAGRTRGAVVRGRGGVDRGLRQAFGATARSSSACSPPDPPIRRPTPPGLGGTKALAVHRWPGPSPSLWSLVLCHERSLCHGESDLSLARTQEEAQP